MSGPMGVNVLTPRQKEIAIAFDKAVITALEQSQETLPDASDAAQFVANMLVGHAVNLARIGYGNDAAARAYVVQLVDFRLSRPLIFKPEGTA